ncbi:hypothetical protein BEWA_024840 [Theileria equi strain WA]|uniref:Major facilitator superfamily MFS-1 protein n=1 Tax=Theileria equi strain WA TaxID=1537102 RepID=L0AVQ9_THEEQ|nr:hypothetical protein BEWA_024840 [Theileria equi strain WA]AFZ79635.1 hypothetical protein BEWA_024840 [Theileria equi strain WA]|eukprot:XP_004829301.1 hypothetical protein BEWA_024840 [Theileria equi strain WA]
MNWIVRLFIYFGIVTVCGPYFDNWTTTEKYLFLSDAYADVCSPTEQQGPRKNTYRCQEQQLRVNSLLSYGRMSEFLSSVFIGISVDCYGPRIVSCIGVILALISWVLLGYFPNYDATLKLSMILVGICTNSTLLPALTIERYTKEYKAQSLIYIGMSSSFTCFLIKGMERILYYELMDHRTLALGFIVFLIIPCLLFSIGAFPAGVLGEAPVEDEKMELSIFTRKTEMDQPEEENTLCQTSAVSVRGERTTQDTESGNSELSSLDGEEKWTFYGFLKAISRKTVILCTLYYAFNVVSLTYSQQALTISYRDNELVLEFTEYLLPLSFVLCLAFMVIYRFLRPITVIVIMSTLFALMHISSLFSGTCWGIVYAIFLSCIYSIYNTQVYIYLESRVSKVCYSSILGFLNTVGGLSILVNMGLMNYIRDYANIPKVYGALLVIRLVFLGIFGMIMLDPVLNVSSRENKR